MSDSGVYRRCTNIKPTLFQLQCLLGYYRPSSVGQCAEKANKACGGWWRLPGVGRSILCPAMTRNSANNEVWSAEWETDACQIPTSNYFSGGWTDKDRGCSRCNAILGIRPGYQPCLPCIVSYGIRLCNQIWKSNSLSDELFYGRAPQQKQIEVCCNNDITHNYYGSMRFTISLTAMTRL